MTILIGPYYDNIPNTMRQKLEDFGALDFDDCTITSGAIVNSTNPDRVVPCP